MPVHGTNVELLATLPDLFIVKLQKKEVTKEALRRFNLYLEEREKYAIPGYLQRIIFKTALKEDESFVFEQLKKIYKNSTFPEEQRNCLIVLGNVTDSELHTQMLEFVLFSGEVRTHV